MKMKKYLTTIKKKKPPGKINQTRNCKTSNECVEMEDNHKRCNRWMIDRPKIEKLMTQRK